MLTEMEPALYPKGVPTPTDATFVTQVAFSIRTLDIPKSFKVSNDSYTLVANTSGVFITSENTYGAARALATLVQVIGEIEGKEYLKGIYGFQPV